MASKDLEAWKEAYKLQRKYIDWDSFQADFPEWDSYPPGKWDISFDADKGKIVMQEIENDK